MGVDIEIVEPRAYDGVVADEIVLRVVDTVTDRGSACVGLAGGSTPANIYRAMTKPPRVDDMPWQKTTFFVGDERWVPHSDSQSNQRMIEESLFHGLEKRPKLIGVATSMDSPEKAATEYAKALAALERIDLVLLGVGEDGHTASLFPGQRAVSERRELVVVTADPNTEKPRVSVTRALLERAERVIFIAKGEGKAAVVQRILEDPESLETLPAQLYRTLPGKVTFFLDSGAAAALRKK